MAFRSSTPQLPCPAWHNRTLATLRHCASVHAATWLCRCDALLRHCRARQSKAFAPLRRANAMRRRALLFPPHCGSVATPSRAMPQHFLHAASHRFAMALPHTALHYPAAASPQAARQLRRAALPVWAMPSLGRTRLYWASHHHRHVWPCSSVALAAVVVRRESAQRPMRDRPPQFVPYSFPERNFPFSSNAT